ncbi:hypothetical protein B0T24DRAFT_638520, partial [Lasiosphaeria ovina]
MRPFTVRGARTGASSLVFSMSLRSLLSSCCRLTPSHCEAFRRMDGFKPLARPVEVAAGVDVAAGVCVGAGVTGSVDNGAVDRGARGSGANAVEPRGLPRRRVTRSNS